VSLTTLPSMQKQVVDDLSDGQYALRARGRARQPVGPYGI
jgi:hypothetical protein